MIVVVVVMMVLVAVALIVVSGADKIFHLFRVTWFTLILSPSCRVAICWCARPTSLHFARHYSYAWTITNNGYAILDEIILADIGGTSSGVFCESDGVTSHQ